VHYVVNKFQRTAIARTGAAIDAVGSSWVEISATPREIAAIRSLGYQVESAPPPGPTESLPPSDSGYHDYDEMVTEVTRRPRTMPISLTCSPSGRVTRREGYGW